MALAVILALFAIFLTLASMRAQIALSLAIFLIPWVGLGVDVGLSVTPFELVMAALLTVIFLRAVNGPTIRQHLARPGILWLLIFYAVFTSLVHLPFLPREEVAGGVLRTPELRALSQIVKFFLTLAPLLTIPVFLRDWHATERLVAVYIKSLVILAWVGWVQLVLWRATGADPLPVGTVNAVLGGNSSLRSGMFTFGQSEIYRMSSFGGEPKSLGVSLAVGLLLLQAAAKKRLTLWGFLFVSMVATFSTMAFLGWAGATAVQLFVSRDLKLHVRTVSGRFDYKIVFAVMMVICLIPVFLISPFGKRFIDVIDQRTIHRVSTSEHGVLEDFNVATLSYLKAQPMAAVTGVGLGNIHLYASPYLPEAAKSYAEGTVFVAKSYVLRWVSELGGVSFAIFLGWLLWNTRCAARYVKRYSGNKNAQAFAKSTVAIMALWMVSGYITPQAMVAGGCALGLVVGGRKRGSRRRPYVLLANTPSRV